MPTPRARTIQVPGGVSTRAVKLKVAVLDEKRAFEGSPKTRKFDEELRTYGRSLEEGLQRLVEEKSNSSEAKASKIEEFKAKAQQEMEEKKVQMRTEILADVAKATAVLARERGYCLVFERGSIEQGIRRALFVSDENALTDPSTEVGSLRSELLALADLTDDVCKSLAKPSP